MLDAWFTDENKKNNFKIIYTTKNVRIPKFLDLEWFSQQGFNFPNLLEAQGLPKLVQMKGTFYPELVKIFYTCARADMEGNLFSTINGLEMVIDDTVWKVVAGLDMGGVCKFEESVDGYNKMQTYRAMLLDPARNLRNHLSVGGLTARDRMLVYLITDILTPRSNNHAQVTNNDLQIVYGLKSGIQMNWVLLIEDIMLKSCRLVDYKFLYAVLASRFIHYFNVDVSNEIVDFTKASNEITKRHIKNLGMRFVEYKWIMAGESPTTTNMDQMEEEAEDEAQQELMHQWSPLESLMIQKMDAMLHLHQEHSVDVHNTLENITTRLENIETRLTLSNLNWMRMKRSYVLVLGFAVC